MNLLFFLAICTWHVASSVQTTGTQLPGNAHSKLKDPAGEISEIQMGFALQLYKATANVETGFFALSTMDAFLLLSQLCNGTNGPSHRQLTNILHCFPDRELGSISDRIYFLRNAGASMNNKIFHPFESQLEDVILQKLSPFGPLPERVASWTELTSGNAIYEWAQNARIVYPHKQTFEGEESLVLAIAGMFSSDLVVNTRYESESTASFYYNDKFERKNLNYLTKKAKINYGEFTYGQESDDGVATAKFIGLDWAEPYENKVKTFFILPNERGGITKLESNINETAILKMISSFFTTWVNTTLPEMIEIDSALDIVEAIKNLGITEIFEEITDPGNVTKLQPIKVGPFLQQVKIHHKWSSDYLVIPGVIPEGAMTEEFNADHAFIIMTVSIEKNPFILSMGRYGWASGTADATTGIVI